MYLVNTHSPWDRRIGFPDPSLEPLRAVPFPSGPPRAPPKLTLEPPGPPRAPKDSQGPLKSARSTIKKRWKYVYLALQDHEKLVFFIFWRFPGAPGTRLGQRPDHPDPPWRPKALQSPPRDLPGRALGPLECPRAIFQNLHRKRSQLDPPNAPPKDPFLVNYS